MSFIIETQRDALRILGVIKSRTDLPQTEPTVGAKSIKIHFPADWVHGATWAETCFLSQSSGVFELSKNSDTNIEKAHAGLLHALFPSALPERIRQHDLEQLLTTYDFTVTIAITLLFDLYIPSKAYYEGDWVLEKCKNNLSANDNVVAGWDKFGDMAYEVVMG